MNQNYLIEEIERHGHVIISEHTILDMFPEPKRTTIEDVEHLMATTNPNLASIVIPEYGLCTAINKGDFAHMFQKTRKEKIADFLERNNVEMQIDNEGFYHFRLNCLT